MSRCLRNMSIALIVTFAGCAGGSSVAPRLSAPVPGSSTTPVPGAAPTPAMAPASATGTARFTISFGLPAAAGRVRRTSYISAKTKSLGIYVTSANGIAPSPAIAATVDVGTGSPACTAAAGTLSCTVAIAAPAGSDVFNVRTFAQAGAQGQPLSAGSGAVTVVAGQTIDAAITLLPVVYTVSFSWSPQSLPIGTAGTFTLTAVAKDSAGDTIGGSDPYYTPITVTSAQTAGHVVATPALPANLTVPGQTLNFAYDGKGNAASYIFNVTVASGLGTNGTAPATGALSFIGGQHLYVSSDAPANAIYVYDIASDGSLSGPSRTLSGSATTLSRPLAIAVDKLGTLYVVNYHRDVTVFAPGAGGNVAPASTFGAGTYPEFIGNNGSTGIALGGAQLVTGSTTQFDQSLETVYLVDIYPNGAPPGSAMVPSIPFIVNGSSSFATSPLPDASGVASQFACFGITPVNSNFSVSCYDGALGTKTTNGTTYPTGPSFGFPEVPGGMAFRSDGLLTVAADAIYMRAPMINTYALPSIGSQAFAYLTPTYSIAGANAGLTYPTGIAFDKAGNLYVTDYGQATGNGTVKQWPRNANGNVAPARTLAGFSFNYSIAVGP